MGWFFLILVIIGFIAMNFFMKLGSLKGHTSLSLTGSLYVVASILSLIFLIFSRQPALVSRPVVFLAIGGGICGALAYFLFLSALKIGNYALTISTITMSFLIPVIFSIIFWKRPVANILAAGIIFILIGIALISAAASTRKEEGKGVWLKWISLLGAAFILNGVPQIAQAAAVRLTAINFWFFLLLTFMTGTVVFGLFFLIKKIKPVWRVFFYGAFAATGSVIGNLFVLKSLGRLPETVVFPVSLAGPVIGAVLLSLLFFREKIKPLGYVGIIIGLAGITLLTLK